MPMMSSMKLALVEYKYGGLSTEYHKDKEALLLALLENTHHERLQKLIDETIPKMIADQVEEENEEPEPLDSEDE